MNDATVLPPISMTQALGATVAATPASSRRPAGPVSAARTTVLPRVAGDGIHVELTNEARARYEPTKLLGAGGMGDVVLVRDHDIDRKVALKRLKPELSDASIVARFVDEIRTVGRLEHPNIVPIHDVGVDELGRYFFVMKYVEGETLESIIDKLAAGDPEYLAKYSIEARIEIFLGILRALEYAHAQGIVHRDVKPANVMVGRFGEVVLMDWGIAKPLGAKRDAACRAEGEIGADGERARMFATRVGSLIGTPAYMSPEQARGDHDHVDFRSDLYSAVVLFHELVGLRHYLHGAPSLEALLASILSRDVGLFQLLRMDYPRGTPPAEILHVCVRGLAKDPARRFQSVGELISRLHGILEGKVPIQCQITFTKRVYRELGRLTDRSPLFALSALVAIAGSLAFTAAQLVRMAFG